LRKAIAKLSVLALIVTLATITAGCGCGSPGGAGTGEAGGSTTTTTATAVGSDEMALEPGEGLADAEQSLTQVLGLAAGDVRASKLVPGSAGADTVLIWAAGKAEVDSATGRVFLVAMNRPQVDPLLPFLSDMLLKHEAGKIPGLLGWGDGMLMGMGFRQEQPGVLATDTGLFTLVWSQYAGDGSSTEGRVEVRVDARSGQLAGFSVTPAGDSPGIEGALSASDAMDIAETHIFLKTKDPEIPLMGDGSLILMDKQVSQELKVVQDRKITKGKQVLTWVIFLSGTVENETVGGTVYVDAMTGAVLSYQPLSEE
jgi:hypothetical protein